MEPPSEDSSSPSTTTTTTATVPEAPEALSAEQVLRRYVEAPHADTEALAAQVFAALDRRRGGTPGLVAVDELRAALLSVFPGADNGDIESALVRCDENEDGRIDRTETVTLIDGLLSPVRPRSIVVSLCRMVLDEVDGL